MAQKVAQQNVFLWEGTDKRGGRIKGEVAGISSALIKAELRRQGIIPVKVRKKPKPLFGTAGKTIKPKDIAIFTRQVATMLAAGVPLVQAFEIIGRGHENPRMQKLILDIKVDVEGGTALGEALAKYPLHFDELYINLVHTGEQAGVLDTLLDKIATYKEKTEAIKGKIKKALFYPAAVIVVAFIVTAILLLFVIPQFEELFAGFGASLPAPTQFVIELSKFMQKYWWMVFGGLVGGILVIVGLKRRSKAFAHLMDRIILKMPVIGEIMRKAAIARFARTLSTTFAAGVPLVEALESVSGATGNIIYGEGVKRMREDVATGQQLQVAMRNTQLFPHMVVQMVAIGEESGALDAMLGKVADFYEEEVDNAVDALSSLLEPLIMAFLGVVVGGLVIAMYLPIFKLAAVV
jgi:type IV pilus assembly protein PilC